MKVVVINSEGYGGLYKIFGYGETHFVIEDSQEEAVRAKFKAWEDQLGPCPDAVKGEVHPLSSHISIRIHDVSQLPAFLVPTSEGDNLVKYPS